MSFQPGERVGDYEVLQVLGAGGMGKVYKVRNIISDRMEAMKVLLPNLESDPELANRFIREIKVQASLQHPNIAGLHTAQRVGNQLVMLMEFIEGRTLEEMLRSGPIPLAQGVKYIQQVLTALEYAHERGVVHRDIKPANMMLTAGEQMKLMDFGIAKAQQDRQLTQTGRTVGSLYYMSPEQINGEKDLDARADLYSLGVSLYEIATGRRPFQGDSDYSIMAAHLQSQPVAPIQIDPKLPAAINDIILMAIAKDPAKRFQTAGALRRALDSVVGSAPAKPAPLPLSAQPIPSGAQTRVKPGSARTLYMAAGSVATLVVLAVAVIQGPKWFRSAASSTPAPAAGLDYPRPADPQDQPGPAAPVPSGSEASAVIPATPPPVTAAGSAAPDVSSPQPAQRPQQTAARPSNTNLSVQVRPDRVVAPQTQENRTPPQVISAPPPAAQSSAPSQAASQPKQAGNSTELSQLREDLMLLGTRANAMIASVTRMEQQQARMGLGMRPEVATGKQRMEFHLNEAEAALRSGDGSKAKRSLDLAGKEVEKLENFFGR